MCKLSFGKVTFFSKDKLKTSFLKEISIRKLDPVQYVEINDSEIEQLD